MSTRVRPQVVSVRTTDGSPMPRSLVALARESAGLDVDPVDPSRVRGLTRASAFALAEAMRALAPQVLVRVSLHDPLDARSHPSARTPARLALAVVTVALTLTASLAVVGDPLALMVCAASAGTVAPPVLATLTSPRGARLRVALAVAAAFLTAFLVASTASAPAGASAMGAISWPWLLVVVATLLGAGAATAWARDRAGLVADDLLCCGAVTTAACALTVVLAGRGTPVWVTLGACLLWVALAARDPHSRRVDLAVAS